MFEAMQSLSVQERYIAYFSWGVIVGALLLWALDMIIGEIEWYMLRKKIEKRNKRTTENKKKANNGSNAKRKKGNDERR